MKLKTLFICCIGILILSGCSSYKRVPYLQNSEENGGRTGKLPMYDAKIMPKDLLTITVNTVIPETAAPFNLVIQTPLNSAKSSQLSQQPSLQQYLVNNEGYIDFPVLGLLQVGGLTKNQAENLIREKLAPYMNERPIVTVRMSNYKISVLGEVNQPGTFSVNNEKVNIFEALAMAGDLTVWGLREKVKLIRERPDGEREIINLNLTDADIVASPYYFLQQNDILYVTPNKTKAKNSSVGNSTALWFSATTILISLASLIVTLLRTPSPW